MSSVNIPQGKSTAYLHRGQLAFPSSLSLYSLPPKYAIFPLLFINFLPILQNRDQISPHPGNPTGLILSSCKTLFTLLKEAVFYL